MFMVLFALHQLSHSAVHARLVSAMDGSLSVRGDAVEKVLVEVEGREEACNMGKKGLAAFTCIMLVLAPVAFVALDSSEYTRLFFFACYLRCSCVTVCHHRAIIVCYLRCSCVIVPPLFVCYIEHRVPLYP